ncbi:MAG: PEGA domain-containing protein [Lachnospiraceae bacterium]|nr:PEGA domain-containing protein [Lachnospiraceae bacterium]
MTGCVGVNKRGSTPKQGNFPVESPAPSEQKAPLLYAPDAYDSEDTATVVAKNAKDGTITFLNHDIQRKYTLSYDGTTEFKDKYMQAVSVGQIECGDVVKVRFIKDKKHISYVQLSDEAWKLTEVSRFNIDTDKKEFVIGRDIYKITDNTRVFTDDRIADISEIDNTDVLDITGVDTEILSVKVSTGHGYLRLVNSEKFLGGYIEVGQSIIKKITDNMLLVVPEGSYKLNFSVKGGEGTKNAVIKRNEETVVDIGDLEVEEIREGTVVFSTEPAGITLYIDGELKDPSVPIRLEYGLHQILAKAEGYKSIIRYIRVAAESAGVDIVLDKEDDESEGASDKDNENEGKVTGDAQTIDDNEDASDVLNAINATGEYSVFVEAPVGVEVYVDGNYVGISPVKFPKTAGSHVITLRKEGYVIKNHTVVIDDTLKDISYSFSDLELSASLQY